jgi:predicted dehydrogenase
MKKPIGTALLSYGMSGYVFHGPLLKTHSGFDILAVYQRSRKSPSHAFTPVYEIADILSSPEIELVIVNTPNEYHFEHAKMALEAGKHVVVEKPFTVTKAEAMSLITLSEKTGKVLTVFQNRRWATFSQFKKLFAKARSDGSWSLNVIMIVTGM